MLKPSFLDWKQRLETVNKLLALIESFPEDIQPKVVKIFDSFQPRLNDSNSKVLLAALNAVNRMVISMKVGLKKKQDFHISLNLFFFKNGVTPVLGSLIPTLVSNLSSTKPEVRAAANTATTSLISSVDNVVLLPFLSGVVLSGNRKIQVALLEKLLGTPVCCCFFFLLGALNTTHRRHSKCAPQETNSSYQTHSPTVLVIS